MESGVTVSLVSLPLSIALSVASGAGPLPGVIASIWACLIAGLFGGSKYNIVGAAGALTTVLSTFAATTTFITITGDTYPLAFALPFVAMITGLIILLIWILRFEKYLIYIPSSVMYGFAAGVAITIAFGQINDALGLHGFKSATHFVEKLEHTFHALDTFSWHSFIVFAITFGIILFLKKIKFVLPGVVVVSVLGVIFGILMNKFGWNLDISTLTSRYPTVNGALFVLPKYTDFWNLMEIYGFWYAILNTSLVVALIGILETLITAKLADSITGDKFNSRKEMLGLGLANIGSGFAGGLPATGVFVRTGLNVKSGATDSTSAIIAAIATGLLTIIFFPFFKYIPMAVIAGILFNTAIGLIEFEKFEHFWKEDKKSFIVAIIVALITIFEDASIGILFGATLALLFFVDKLSRGEFEAMMGNKKNPLLYHTHGTVFECNDEKVETVVYSIEGILVYLDSSSHAENLERIAHNPNIKNVVIRMRDLFYVDVDGVETLVDIIKKLEGEGKNIMLTKPRPEVRKVLAKTEFFKKFVTENKLFEKTSFALDSLGYPAKK